MEIDGRYGECVSGLTVLPSGKSALAIIPRQGRVDIRKITVLVGEDQPLLRLHAIDMIQDAGFIALEAEHSDAGIAIMRLSSDVQSVFTDVEMPGSMDGIEFAICGLAWVLSSPWGEARLSRAHCRSADRSSQSHRCVRWSRLFGQFGG